MKTTNRCKSQHKLDKNRVSFLSKTPNKDDFAAGVIELIIKQNQ